MTTGPLAGMRVLDAATLLAAPTTASLLSEFGAEVIKIEQPTVGDPIRGMPPFRGDVSLLWKVVARNRKSVTVDLRLDEGRQVFKQLAGESDVVILNYRPATLAKWGLDFNDLVQCRSDLVVLHLTAYGRTGPYSERPGFARVAEAFAGLTYRTGYPDRPPVLSGYALGDGIAGMYGAYSVMLALRERDRSGEAQLIDLGLYEPVFRLMEDLIVGYGEDGSSIERIGNSNPLICPNGLFPTKDGQYVVIPASTEQMWRRLVELIGDETLLAFGNNSNRIEHREEIDTRVAEYTQKHALAELIDLFDQAGVACGPVNSAADVARDPHIAARGSIVDVDDPETGKSVLMSASAGRFSGFTAQVREPGPKLGEHTDEVLSNLLEYSQSKIETLRSHGAI